MKAITICQPWAWAIAAGHKRVENRCWQTKHRGPLVIHAGDWLEFGCAWIESVTDLVVPADLTFGALLGVCDLVDCVEWARSPDLQCDRWADGPWCWRLANFRPLPEPVPYRGALGLFEVPDSLIASEGQA